MNKKRLFLTIILIPFFVLGSNKVKVDYVKKLNYKKRITLYGKLYSKIQVPVSTRIAGIIVKMKKSLYAPVKKGETLFVVKRDDPGFHFVPFPVKSPISGVVVKLDYPQGSRVSPSRPVLIVASYNPIYMSANVSAEEFYKLKKGMKALIKVNGVRDDFTGIISSLLLPSNPRELMSKVEIKIKNSELKLLPGMLVKAEIVVSEEEKLFIPLESLLTERGEAFVFVVKNGKAYKKTIKTGIIYNSMIEVIEGLSFGEKVVVLGQENLKNGSIVAEER